MNLSGGDGTSSFYQFVQDTAPHILPRADGVGSAHGTTILALHTRDGVVMAGDRRATMGNLIAQRDLRKLEPADSHSGVAFAGAVAFGVEMVRLFQLELKHYEKVEGVELSFPAKVNRLAVMIRGRLAQAMEGMAAVPMFAGWDFEQSRGRIITFDVAGSPSEERDFGGIGSGWHFAKGALKKLHRPGLDRSEAVRVAMQALFDAADDDSATGGPDGPRRILPTVSVITKDGYEEVANDELAEHLPYLTVG